MATLSWTGQRSRGAGLLYLDYDNLGTVRDEGGKRIGEVVQLTDGYYRPQLDGLRGADCATADQALHAVVELYVKYRKK